MIAGVGGSHPGQFGTGVRIVLGFAGCNEKVERTGKLLQPGRRTEDGLNE